MSYVTPQAGGYYGARVVDVIKTLLAGCGALALLSVVGCVGLVGVGSYAVEQAIDEERSREHARLSNEFSRHNRNSSTRNSQGFSDDPFSGDLLPKGLGQVVPHDEI